MGVKYDRLNTSAARRSKSRPRSDPPDPVSITPAGVRVLHTVYGAGTTEYEFVSECDNVACRMDSGDVVIFKGGMVRAMAREFLRKQGDDKEPSRQRYIL